MTDVFFTSDLHFGHENIIKYCKRPFATADEMDREMIANWNSVVKHDDIVYVLGDVFFCDERRAKEIGYQLHGQKLLVYGNHDKMIRKAKPMQSLFHTILPDLYHTSIEGTRVVMCHYPLMTWNHAYRGSFMLHGHTHGRIPVDGKCRRMDVGVDAHCYTPIHWRDIKRTLNAIDPTSVKEY